MKTRYCTLLAALAMLIPVAAGAQDYPVRPVKLVVGFPPGGNVDLVARIVAQKLSEDVGRQFFAENRPGASGIPATDYVVKSTADGYTLLVVSGAFVTTAVTQKKLSYDSLRDLAWVSTVVTYPLVFAVRPDSRFKTLDDFIGYAKANPGKINYPSPGVGTLYHLAAEMFNSMAGIDLVHVPFRGGNEPIIEVLSGRMEMLIDAVTNAYAHIQGGRLRALAVTSAEPSPSLPGVPTVAQSLPGYEATSFLGIAAPRDTPPAIVERLNRALRRALDAPDIRQRFTDFGGMVRSGTPAEMGQLIEAEIAKWKRVVEARHIELQ